MAAPEYVPTDQRAPRSYRSPDVVPESWSNDRAGSVGTEQPVGPALGYQGPDQGYVLTLVRHFDSRVILAEGEQRDDVMAGAVEIAMKRASIFGRAPVVYDLEIALRVWGFLAEPPAELIEARRCFQGVANPYHWRDLRRVVAKVPESTLRNSPAEVETQHLSDWRSLLDPDAG